MTEKLTNLQLQQSVTAIERSQIPLYVQSVGRSTYPAGEGWGPGMRSHYLFCLVLRGEGTYCVGENCFHVREGDLFLIAPRRRIELVADKGTEWENLWVRFSGCAADKLIVCTELSVSPVYRGEDGEIRAIMEEMEKSAGVEPWQRLAASGCLYQLFSCLLRDCERFSRTVEPYCDCAQIAAEYIVNHYEEPITVEGLAAYTAVSHSSLYRRFVKRYGVSPKRFLLEYRVEQACRMLAESRGSVQEIAVSVGFEDPFYFSRAFKEVKGVSPRQYAASLREQK